MRGDGTGLRLLTGDAALDRVPRWSPDGSRVAYFSNRSGILQLWLIAADGSGNRQLTETEFSSFGAWSPDGSLIAVNGTPPGAPSGAGVQIVHPDVPWPEQEPRVLSPPDSAVAPQFTVNDWSPDGSRLAGMVGVADEGIIIYDLDSGAYERLTDYGQWPVWLPDARRILFVTGGDSLAGHAGVSRKARRATREAGGGGAGTVRIDGRGVGCQGRLDAPA